MGQQPSDFKITMKKTVYDQDEIDRRLLEVVKIVLAHRQRREGTDRSGERRHNIMQY